jgi:hypothetical protein
VIPILYRSTDASAPVLTGQVGSLIALLDACLVTGYGSKSAAGWGKPFTGTNLAVFRAPSGVRHYLDVDDTGPDAGAAREARIAGYETMSAVGTGTQRFPAAGTNIICRKSATADATARAWHLYADDKTFYLWVVTGDIASTAFGMMFGEFFSFLTGDAARTLITGRNTVNAATAVADVLSNAVVSLATAQTHSACPRSYTGLGAAINLAKTHDHSKTSAGTDVRIGVGVVPYPNPTDGGLYLSDILLSESASQIRGKLRGLVSQLHPVASFAQDDIFQGSGPLAGKEYRFVCRTSNANWAVFETTEWEASS